MLLLLTALSWSFTCCKRLTRLPFVKQHFIPAEPERISSKRVIQGDCVNRKRTDIGAEHVLADSRLTDIGAEHVLADSRLAYIAEDLDMVTVGDSGLAAWIKYDQ